MLVAFVAVVSALLVLAVVKSFTKERPSRADEYGNIGGVDKPRTCDNGDGNEYAMPVLTRATVSTANSSDPLLSKLRASEQGRDPLRAPSGYSV